MSYCIFNLFTDLQCYY